MAKESNIVQYINDTLKTEQFGASKFSKGTFNGIAELVKSSETGETKPATIANNGECTYIGINDAHPFQIYHRTLSASFELVDSDFGDFKVRRQTDNMTMVIIADRERTEVTKEQIISAVSIGFPLELPATNKSALSLLQCNMTPETFLTDYNDVWSREFSITQSLLKPQTIMVALDYSITTDVVESCIEICA
jgi:hypothetical protein